MAQNIKPKDTQLCGYLVGLQKLTIN